MKHECKRKTGRTLLGGLRPLLVMVLLAGCAGVGADAAGSTAADGSTAQYEASHGSDAAPDYAVVFPQDAVNRIDITLAEDAWADLQAEMTGQLGTFGQGETDGPMGEGAGQVPQAGRTPGQVPQVPEGDLPPVGVPQGQAPGGFQGNRPAGGEAPKMDFADSSYVPGTVTFNGEIWENVGFRYSGNSTLQSSWRKGTLKISFRLDFDEFKESANGSQGQRFYGFKQISFKSNAMDSSYLREKVAADIFRAAGVAASQTAFYEVYLDYGEGPVYLGLYTAVEIVDDTLIETQFSDDSGNVYKPDGPGAAFVEGTFNPESFEKQTNKEEGDWSDIQAVFAALHSDLRSSDPAAWRAGLEAVFDVDAFLRWLAVDTILQNWDTYGNIAHNYYLYTDPEDGLVTWIPWDNNMSLNLSAAPGGVEAPAGGGQVPGGDLGGNQGGRPAGRRAVRELDLEAVGGQWPLIRYLVDDPVYEAKYRQYLAETIETAFQPDLLAGTYQFYHELIAPYVQRESADATQLASYAAFEKSLAELIAHAGKRYTAVLAYLSEQ